MLLVYKVQISKSEDLKCRLYTHLSNLGYKLCAEYRIDNCRVNIALIHKGYIAGFIEVKNNSLDTDTKQFQKYLKYNVPVCIFSKKSSINDIENFCKSSIEILEKKLSVIITN